MFVVIIMGKYFLNHQIVISFFLEFRKSPSNPRRYRKQVICGYSVPMLFLILTGIAEASLGQCSRFRPRFNEQSCFFSGILAHKNYGFNKFLFLKLFFD